MALPTHLLPTTVVGSYPQRDCGMKYLAREVAFGKLKALAAGAAIVRQEIS